MKSLIIAEKYSVAKTIAEALHVSRKGKLFENDQYIITNFVGHLVSLAMPEAYGDNYKLNMVNETHLPIIPPSDRFIYVENPQTKDQLSVIKQQLKRNDVDQVVNACDAGREGELIFRNTINYLGGSTKPIYRLWVSSLEESAILNGLKNMKPQADYDPLFRAALARQLADWLVGMNGSTIYRLMFSQRTPVSVGRVQTPTLNAICVRDQEIANFVPKDFFTVKTTAKNTEFETERFDDGQLAQKIQQQTNGKTGIITKCLNKEKNAKPPKLYDLTTLQKDANQLFQMTADETLKVAQLLYEEKLTSYPRTDSQYITEDMRPAVNDLVVKAPFQIKYQYSPNLNPITNNKKVQDHTAILPTQHSLTDSGMKRLDELTQKSRLAKNIYLLIYIRLLMATAETRVMSEQQLELTIEGIIFKRNLTTIVNNGYYNIWEELSSIIGLKNKGKSVPPQFDFNETFPDLETEVHQGKTTPKPHYTEATLLAFMERAGVEELDDSLETEKKGLGTPATRASIIETLINKQYIKRDKKSLISTIRGKKLISVMYDPLKDAKITAQWENYLTKISLGTGDFDRFMASIHRLLQQLVTIPVQIKSINNIPSQYLDVEKPADKPIGKCPVCKNGLMMERKFSYNCSESECGASLSKKPIFFKDTKRSITRKMAEKIITGKPITIPKIKTKSGKEMSMTFVLKVNKTEKATYLNLENTYNAKERKES